MSNKDSKVPILIVIVVAVILIAAGGYYIMGGKITPGKTGAVNGTTPVPTAKETTAAGQETPVANPAGTSAVVTAPAKVDTIKCELCHTDPQNLPPHVNGGKALCNMPRKPGA